MNQLKLWSLNDFLLLNILKFLLPHEVLLKVSLIDRRNYKMTKSREAAIIKMFIVNFFGLSLDKEIVQIITSSKKLIHLLLQAPRPGMIEDIKIIGFKTNGGMDVGNLKYWIFNAFSVGDHCICTQSGRNFDIMGCLSSFVYLDIISDCQYLKMLIFLSELLPKPQKSEFFRRLLFSL